jgi:hypothetical protein
MGILDNEFMRLILSGSPYMQSRERERIATERSQQFTGLLNKYPEQQEGPAMPGQEPAPGQPGGAPMTQIPGRFFLEAAAIPGYEALAQCAQSQAGAMERQQQGQMWDKNNMSLYQSGSLQAQNDQLEEMKRQWANLSPAQQAQIGLGYGNLGVAQGQLSLAQQKDARDQGKNPFMPSTYKEYQEVVGAQNTFGAAKNALGDLGTLLELGEGSSLPKWMQGGKGQALNEQYRIALRPVVSKMIMGNRTDAPGEADLKQIESVLGDITGPGLTETKKNRIKMLEAFVDQQYAPYANLTGPLKYAPGKSPFAQVYGMPAVQAKDVGQLKPYRVPGMPQQGAK